MGSAKRASPASSSLSARSPAPTQAVRNVVFFHPDLGIGGAERLIVDAAVGLQELGNKVTIFTSHCDPNHCFDEAKDGTLDVRVRGHSLFPPTILNRFHILLATLRQIHLVLSIAVFSSELDQLKPDVFIVDQLSACVPLLRWLYPNRQRTLFYCHFPDQLLADRHAPGILGLLKWVYRLPFDWFEGWSMSGSDKIVVNSNFTKGVAARVWPALHSSLGVVYPCVNADEQGESGGEGEKPLWDNKFKILLSINRYERKKDIGLAIRAYQALSESERRGTRLIIAGGYDQRVTENVQYHRELTELAEQSGLASATAKTVPTALAVADSIQVLFLLSVPGPFKKVLLQNASLLLYTPTNEHFGIVPVEAMQYGLPVLAADTGGPLETVVEDETGWHRDVTKVDAWTAVIRKVLCGMSPAELHEIARNGKRRVDEYFTRQTMARKFSQEMEQMAVNTRSTFIERRDIFLGFGVFAAFVAALIAVLVKARFGGSKRAGELARARRMNSAAAPHE